MKKLCILVCPMDWGLGHASRCIPVIRAFLAAGCRVVVAASGPGAGLIKREFQQAMPAVSNVEGSSGANSGDKTAKLNYGGLCTDDQEPASDSEEKIVLVPFPGFSVRYSRKFLFLRLIFQIPSFLYHMSRERKELKKLAGRFSPDLVVSDNRYGLVHPSIPSVIITHQLSPAVPGLPEPFRKLVSRVIRVWVRRFDECWIPDRGDRGAAGSLAAGMEKLPAAFYTGWLSRFSLTGGDCVPDFKGYPGSAANECRYRVMFILSGPEPHRSDLEEIVTGSLTGFPFKVLLVRGVPGGFPERESRDNIKIVSFMDSVNLQKAVNDSEMIVCRSGYSSVMDLLVMGKDALLVPTPGQPEQEYLGRWLREKGWFRVVSQKDLKKEIRSLIREGHRKNLPFKAKIFKKVSGPHPAASGITGKGDEAPGACFGIPDACDDMLKNRVELILKKIVAGRGRIRR